MSSIINIGISKYRNTGNTCYLNSILSVLQQTPLFADYLITNTIPQIKVFNSYHNILPAITTGLKSCFQRNATKSLWRCSLLVFVVSPSQKFTLLVVHFGCGY